MELISKEKVLEILNWNCSHAIKVYEDIYHLPIKTISSTAIKDIERLPTVELKGSFKPDGEYEYIIPHEKMKKLAEAVGDFIRPKGKWIEDTGLYATCSNCKENLYQAIEYKFRPNCGAEMESEE